MSKLKPEWALVWIGDRTLRVSLGDDPTPAANARVRAAFRGLKDASIPGVTDLAPAYTSVLVTVDLDTLDPGDAESRVRRALAAAERRALQAPRRFEIPVCYEGDCAPDLDDVARHHGMPRSEVVALHAGAEYTVAFLGFTPGFPYLLGLPERLAMPRLERPRVRVPAGSVGLAGSHTGIYPSATPGGWRLIGRTPLRLFDASRGTPALLAPGDAVRFVPISRERFDSLAPGA